MAVYFEPPGKSWLDYVMPVGQQLLGGFIDGMFERDKEARQYKNKQREIADAQAQKEAEEAKKLEFLKSYDFQSYNPRTNPQEALRFNMEAVTRGINDTLDFVKHVFPHMQYQDVNLSDRNLVGGFNPMSGQFNNQEFKRGIEPTEQFSQLEASRRSKYSEDAATGRSRANVGLGYARLNADKAKDKQVRQYDPTPILNEAGEYTLVNPYAGELKPTGVKGYAKPEQGAKVSELGNIRKQYIDPFTNQPMPGYEETVAGIDRELAKNFGGNNPLSSIPPETVSALKQRGYSDEDIIAWAAGRKK